MKTIWKYELGITGVQGVGMPAGAQILMAQMQNDRLCVWALVDPKATPTQRTFYIYGTGHQIEPDLYSAIYVATVQQGAFVWHVFQSATP